MRPLVPTLNCVKLKDYLLVPVTIHTICMVLFMPTKTVGTHAATCDRVVLVTLASLIIMCVCNLKKEDNLKSEDDLRKLRLRMSKT